MPAISRWPWKAFCCFEISQFLPFKGYVRTRCIFMGQSACLSPSFNFVVGRKLETSRLVKRGCATQSLSQHWRFGSPCRSAWVGAPRGASPASPVASWVSAWPSVERRPSALSGPWFCSWPGAPQSWLCSLTHRAPPEPTSHPAQGALVAFAIFRWRSERLAPSAVCRRAPPLDLGSPGSLQAHAHAAAAGG